MWLMKVLGVIYFLAVCAAQTTENFDYDDESPTTRPPPSTATPTVYEPPPPTLQLQSSWLEVFPSEKVEFKCSLEDSSGWSFNWWRNAKQVQDPDPMLSYAEQGSLLTITAASQAYSGSYSCKGHHDSKGDTPESNSLELKVYPNKPKPSVIATPNFDIMFPGESVTFRCIVDVFSGWGYLWYHDGREIPALHDNNLKIDSLALSDSGQYHCKAKRGKGPFYTEQSDTTTLKVSEPPTPTLKLQTSWSEVFQNERLELSCEVDRPGWTFTWYSKGKELVQDSVLMLSDGGSNLNITSVSQAHEGSYACKAHLKSRSVSSGFSNKMNIKVDANKPKPSMVATPNFDIMFPGESVTFRCIVDGSAGWDYLWYHDGREIPALHDDNLKIDYLALSDSGQYHCKAKRGKGPFYTEQSDTTTLKVSEPPTPTLKLQTSWSEVFQNERLVLSCEVDRPGWTFTWYCKGKELVQDSVLMLSDGGSNLNITSVLNRHQGTYACKAHLKSRSVSSGFSNKMNIKVHENTPEPSLGMDPVLNPMYVGETVTFTCNVHVGSSWKYQWYKDGNELSATNKTLRIHLGPVDGGKYTCKATRGERTSTDTSYQMDLNVLDIPVPSLNLRTQWVDLFPTESVTLNCGMVSSSDWTYKWFRDDQEIHQDRAVSFGPDGATLTISSASALHHGRYSCSGQLKGRSVYSNRTSGLTLDVYDSKPSLILTQNPEHELMHTGDSVSFSCHINVSSGWEYRWYKDDSPLTGFRNNYTISSVVTKDTGSYQCRAIRGKTTVFHTDKSQALALHIEERPSANIILLTGWSEAFSTDILTLNCKVQDSQDWNFAWFKDGKPINLSRVEKHMVTPQNDPEQSSYTCKGIRTGRPSYSKYSDSFKTKNLLLKRRVLLSISGCLFFGIIAVFLGCIILRVVRKPADNDTQPEEAELFLTMAQLKDRADAPCPLVEYITDASINAPPKDGDDMVSSETTPLPITLQENQDVTTVGNDTAETNGGLVSFKQ